MNILQLRLKSDLIGALASVLCLVHCIATPLLFMAQAGMVENGEAHPKWWGVLDMIFLGISFIAIWWSVKTTSKNWMRNALWISWAVLASIILNEKMSLFPVVEQAIYVPSTILVLLHLYNRKYCNCREGQCCTDKKLNT
ncbi:hypothetical protein GCM10022393_30410 [Aquimarina addita]|uniref:MerC domain-containing protein n=1 Tax=Aquimarina addita TaxID=870485 RepID=A0ABP6UNC7_9FLAO